MPAVGGMCGHGDVLGDFVHAQGDARILPSVPGILDTSLSVPVTRSTLISKNM